MRGRQKRDPTEASRLETHASSTLVHAVGRAAHHGEHHHDDEQPVELVGQDAQLLGQRQQHEGELAALGQQETRPDGLAPVGARTQARTSADRDTSSVNSLLPTTGLLLLQVLHISAGDSGKAARGLHDAA